MALWALLKLPQMPGGMFWMGPGASNALRNVLDGSWGHPGGFYMGFQGKSAYRPQNSHRAVLGIKLACLRPYTSKDWCKYLPAKLKSQNIVKRRAACCILSSKRLVCQENVFFGGFLSLSFSHFFSGSPWLSLPLWLSLAFSLSLSLSLSHSLDSFKTLDPEKHFRKTHENKENSELGETRRCVQG